MLKKILTLFFVLLPIYSLQACADEYGIFYNCTKDEINNIEHKLVNLFTNEKINEYVVFKNITDEVLQIYIPKNYAVGSNMYVKLNPIYEIKDEVVIKNIDGHILRETVPSKKEILISMLYPGRKTILEGKSGCDVNSLDKILTTRQNVVFWTKKATWGWPDGESATWNDTLWNSGTPISLRKSFNDMFTHQNKYKIGCYTATKAIYIQSFLDTYSHSFPKDYAKVEMALNRNSEPFVGVEPNEMWYFEDDYSPDISTEYGKILGIVNVDSSKNFVPGDWVYMRNTDEKSNKKTGYEGSNTIYLGSGLFSDYYEDHKGAYPYERKLDEVFQWRNGVFSRSFDGNKIQVLSESEREKLSYSPINGGVVENYRISPLLF